MRKLIALSTTLFLLLMVYRHPRADVHAAGQDYRHVPRPQQASSAYDLIAAVNDLRAINGLSSYQIDSILMAVTQAHSEYQASIGTVTHYGADGSRPFERALAAGYAVAGDLSLGGWYSENIMAGRNLTAQEAVNAWMGDAPHQNTMLSTTLQDVGAGIAVVGDYVYYTLDASLSTGSSPAPYTPAPTIPPSSGVNINTLFPSTPNADGSIVHIVQSGDSLIAIAIAYGVPLDEILKINNFQLNSVIRIGQKITIRPAFTPTPTLPTETPTHRPSPTLWPTSTPTIKPSITLPPTVVMAPLIFNIPPSSAIPSAIMIILLALILAGVVSWLWSRGGKS